MSSRRKGTRNERKAAELYRGAGFSIQRFRGNRYREKDGFGAFDLLAMRQESNPVFIQVKTNQANGIRSANDRVRSFFPFGRALFHYAVRHDREGWRLFRIEPGTHHKLVDERDSDANMGEGVKDYLRGAISGDER